MQSCRTEPQQQQQQPMRPSAEVVDSAEAATNVHNNPHQPSLEESGSRQFSKSTPNLNRPEVVEFDHKLVAGKVIRVPKKRKEDDDDQGTPNGTNTKQGSVFTTHYRVPEKVVFQFPDGTLWDYSCKIWCI